MLAFTNALLEARAPGAPQSCIFDGSLQSRDALLRKKLTRDCSTPEILPFESGMVRLSYSQVR